LLAASIILLANDICEQNYSCKGIFLESTSDAFIKHFYELAYTERLEQFCYAIK